MSVLEQIRMASRPAPQIAELPVSQDDIEIKLRRKAGVLAAFGLNDKAIADTLFLTAEQVAAIKETTEYRESCAKQTEERTQRLIDLEEGWDSVEAQSVGQVLSYLQHSRDPQFALRAAVFANRAQRRSPNTMGRVIDASNVGNVITFNVSKTYVTNMVNTQEGGTHATIDVQSKSPAEIPRKASDISSPRKLSQILGVQTQERKEQEIAKQAEILGISMDELDEMVPNRG